MEKSASIKNLAAALGVFQVKVGKIPKGDTNPFFNSKYAALPTILEAIQIPLEDCGLVISQFPDGDHGLTTILIHHESGEYLQATYQMKPTKDDPQGLGSCITYQRRYALGAVLGLNIDEDDDGNKASEAAPQQNKTTAPIAPKYNNADKPWLSDDNFANIKARMQAGEKDLFKKTLDNYKMKKTFYSELSALSK